MDTAEVASLIGTTPRVLRAFLRSNHSTFVAVGSGARYSFTQAEIPTLKRRFTDWQKDGKPRPGVTPEATVKTPPPSTKAIQDQRERDEMVWSEEEHVELEDIRDPKVRARVRADAQAAEDRLMERLIAAGLHLFQGHVGSSNRKASN